MATVLPRRVNEFLKNRKTRNKSEGGSKGYATDLKILFQFLRYDKELHGEVSIEGMEDIDIENIDDNFIKEITIYDLNKFIDYVADERENKACGIARKIATIKSFYNYLCKNDILDKNIGMKLENVTIPERDPVFMSLEETKKLLATIKERKGKYMIRDYTIVQILVNCGFRLSELEGLNLKNIDFDNNIISVIGKGNKERKVAMNNSVLKTIKDYLEYRKTIGISIVDEDKNALFLSQKNKRLDKRTIEDLVKKYMKLAGLDTELFHVHTCRHTAATLMHKHGKVDIRTLQKILGHKTLNITERYVHVCDEQIQDAVNSMPEL
jgi:integrase/recombinase XerD